MLLLMLQARSSGRYSKSQRAAHLISTSRLVSVILFCAVADNDSRWDECRPHACAFHCTVQRTRSGYGEAWPLLPESPISWRRLTKLIEPSSAWACEEACHLGWGCCIRPQSKQVPRYLYCTYRDWSARSLLQASYREPAKILRVLRRTKGCSHSVVDIQSESIGRTQDGRARYLCSIVWIELSISVSPLDELVFCLDNEAIR